MLCQRLDVSRAAIARIAPSFVHLVAPSAFCASTTIRACVAGSVRGFVGSRRARRSRSPAQFPGGHPIARAMSAAVVSLINASSGSARCSGSRPFRGSRLVYPTDVALDDSEGRVVSVAPPSTSVSGSSSSVRCSRSSASWTRLLRISALTFGGGPSVPAVELPAARSARRPSLDARDSSSQALSAANVSAMCAVSFSG